MADLHFYIDGDAAEQTAHDLERLLGEHFQQPVQRESAPMPKTDQHKAADPWAVAAVLLALPGAIEASLTLAQRLELKAKFERLVEFARQQFSTTGTRIWVKHKKQPLPLDEATLSELLDDDDL